MSAAERNRNPYKDVNWQTNERIQGCTHMHCQNADIFSSYIEQGLEFATFSNYYPSTPTWPIRDIYENDARLKQASYLCNHKFVDEELDFRKFFAEHGLDLSQLPADRGKRKYPDPPAGFLEAPNAEHAWFSDYNVYLHICAVGSTLTTSMDKQNAALLKDHGFELGFPVTWREGFDLMLDKLLIPDGGGITINHPNWSHLPTGDICAMLDHDPRVLGIEIFSNDADLCLKVVHILVLSVPKDKVEQIVVCTNILLCASVIRFDGSVRLVINELQITVKEAKFALSRNSRNEHISALIVFQSIERHG